MLMYRNNYGEPIICRVKENGAFDKADLAIALFDARETGQIEGDVQEVELPNGETFIIDADHGQDAKLSCETIEKEESGECCQIDEQEDAFALTFENEINAAKQKEKHE